MDRHYIVIWVPTLLHAASDFEDFLNKKYEEGYKFISISSGMAVFERIDI